MSVKLRDIAPGLIEKESFKIIESELGPTDFSPEQFAVVQRMIHASGDLDFAQIARFHPGAVDAGINAIMSGRDVLVDVNMAVQGISRKILEKFGGKVICHIGDEEAARLSKDKGITRAEAGMELAVSSGGGNNIGIVAIGNAPTALVHVIRMVRQSRFRPGLIIGVPVGFVNAAESKEMLMELDHPYISIKGRKGGTAIAVAAVNAILRLCLKREKTGNASR